MKIHENPMMIYPQFIIQWEEYGDYNLMTTVPGLYAIEKLIFQIMDLTDWEHRTYARLG